tara:strand:- start:278 stop:583 length:306 start_codon:yes stop_codon:yes gene_type:complete
MSLDMYKIIKDLFPICRSITGPGIKKSLSYFENLNSKFKRVKFKTGLKVYDWKVPQEWHIYDCYIQDPINKKKFADFRKKFIYSIEDHKMKKKFINRVIDK